MSGSLTQFSINRDRLITDIPGDIAIINLNNQLISDCNFGIYWSGEKHFVGISGYNLFENKNRFNILNNPYYKYFEQGFLCSWRDIILSLGP